MTMARIENHGPGPVRVQLEDGTWQDVPIGEVVIADIRLVNNGKRRTRYTLGPADDEQ